MENDNSTYPFKGLSKEINVNDKDISLEDFRKILSIIYAMLSLSGHSGVDNYISFERLKESNGDCQIMSENELKRLLDIIIKNSMLFCTATNTDTEKTSYSFS
jgi:hypothetical protein